MDNEMYRTYKVVLLHNNAKWSYKGTFTSVRAASKYYGEHFPSAEVIEVKALNVRLKR